jgi:hypothetical protein
MKFFEIAVVVCSCLSYKNSEFIGDDGRNTTTHVNYELSFFPLS